MLLAAPALLSPLAANLGLQIVNGRPARGADFPYMVALSRVDPGTGMRVYFCGGTLVARQWVLSAAHCFFDQHGNPLDARDLWAAVRAEDLRAYPAERQIAASRIIVHPRYSAVTLANDIALVRLAAAPPDPVLTRLAASPAQESGRATIIGYGSQGEGQLLARDRNNSGERIGVLSARLMRADILIRPTAACAEQLASLQDVPGFEGVTIDSSQLCAGGTSSDTCQGDSGGPLLVGNSRDGHLQAGIVSFGRGCARQGFDAVYTRISAHRSWIEATIGPSPPAPTPSVSRQPRRR